MNANGARQKAVDSVKRKSSVMLRVVDNAKYRKLKTTD
jgi:hypothetical protein